MNHQIYTVVFILLMVWSCQTTIIKCLTCLFMGFSFKIYHCNKNIFFLTCHLIYPLPIPISCKEKEKMFILLLNIERHSVNDLYFSFLCILVVDLFLLRQTLKDEMAYLLKLMQL